MTIFELTRTLKTKKIFYLLVIFHHLDNNQIKINFLLKDLKSLNIIYSNL